MTALSLNLYHCSPPVLPPGCRSSVTSRPLPMCQPFLPITCSRTELTLGEDLTRNTGELVGQSVEEVIQLLRQLGASIVGCLRRRSVTAEEEDVMSLEGSYGGLSVRVAVVRRHSCSGLVLGLLVVLCRQEE